MDPSELHSAVLKAHEAVQDLNVISVEISFGSNVRVHVRAKEDFDAIVAEEYVDHVGTDHIHMAKNVDNVKYIYLVSK